MGSAKNKTRELAELNLGKSTRKKAAGNAGTAGSGKGSSAGSGKSAANATKNASSASNERMKNQTKPKKSKTSIEENPLARRNSQVLQADAQPRRARNMQSHPAAASKPRPERKTRPVRDAYDAYDHPPRRPAGGKKRKKKKKGAFSGVSFLLLMVILALCGFGYWRVQEYEALTEMKAVVSRQTFHEGTIVDGVDVSSMTLEQALSHWDTQVEPAYRKAAVVLNDGTTVTAEQLGYTSNYAQVLSGAWSAGRSGSLVERYKRIEQYKAQPREHAINRVPYQDALVRQYVENLAQQVDSEPRNASLKSFNTASYEFEFEPEQNGYRLNRESMVANIERALSGGGGSVNLDIDTISPQITQANVSSQYGMICYAVTNAASSSSNRLSNIKLALNSINGLSLAPGESFSFNHVVGQRTTARGYKTATAYSAGKVTEEVGGGICQVSTTLFNAVVKADLQIDERHPHSLTVSYVDLGKDAAVDWGNKDLRFTNNSDDRIYIMCYLTDDKRIRIGVFGKLLENGMSITVEGVKTDTIDYKTEYQMNFAMYSGQTRVAQKGKNGYKATAYKIWWDANGNEIKKEALCKSTYQSTPEIIEYGP